MSSWLALALSLGSVWFYGKKSLIGPILGSASFPFWLWASFHAKDSGMITAQFVFLALHLKNLWRMNK